MSTARSNATSSISEDVIDVDGNAAVGNAVVADDYPEVGCIEISDDESSNDGHSTVTIRRKPINRKEMLKEIKTKLSSLNEYNKMLNSERVTKSSNNELFRDMTQIAAKHSNRINEMYIEFFKSCEVDESVLEDYIRFASNIKGLTPAFRDVLDNLMESNHLDPKVYIIIACYVFNVCNDIMSARRYFRNGIKNHCNCKELYFEEICMEIKYYHRTDDIDDSHEIPLEKYKQIIDMFEDEFNLHISLVDKVLKNLPSVGVLENNVVGDMIIIYEKNELMWQKLAKINLEGVIYDFKLEKLCFVKDNNSRIKYCIDTYEKATAIITFPEDNQNIWNIFLDEIIEFNNSSIMQNQDMNDYLKLRSVAIFLEAFYRDKLQKADHFIFLDDHSYKGIELVVLKKSVTVVKESVDLWKRLLSYFMERENYGNGMDVFKEGVHILKNDGLPLWERMELHLLNKDDGLLEKIYEQGSCHEQTPYENINWEIRINYLQWKALRGVQCARDLFEKLKKLHPPCLQLYKEMINLEKTCTTDDKTMQLPNIRRLYIEASIIFGKKNIALWIDFMKLEYIYGDQRLVQWIYDRAMGYLDADLKNSFIDLKKELDLEFTVKVEKNDEIDNSEDYEPDWSSSW